MHPSPPIDTIVVVLMVALLLRPLSDDDDDDDDDLSYDVCLAVRGEILRTVLCCIVY